MYFNHRTSKYQKTIEMNTHPIVYSRYSYLYPRGRAPRVVPTGQPLRDPGPGTGPRREGLM